MIRRRSFAALGAGAVLAPAVLRAQGRTVTWMTHPVIFDATAKGEMFRDFTATTGLRVEVTTFPTDALAQRVPAEFAANSDAFDVISIAESFWTTALARFAEPLEPWAERAPLPAGGLADFSPGMLDQFRVPQNGGGRLLGIPHRMSTDILYYRRDLLERAGLGVPRTLDEYHAAARALTRPDMSGLVYQGVQSQQGVLDWYSWAAAMGVDILAPPEWRQAAFNTPAGVRSLEMRRRVVAEGLANPGVLGYSFDDAVNAMAQGRAAMSIMFSAYWARLEDQRASTVAGRIGYAPVPRDPSVTNAYFVRGWSAVLNRASRRKDAAWEFVRHFTGPEMQKRMALEFGNPVSRISVARDPEVIAKVPVTAASAEALANAKIQPNTPRLPRVWDALARHVSAAQAGTVQPAAALAAAEADVNAVLR
ncbi:sugar ABC transporter substrate-binding protein [Leptolyngbya sp. 15MV]|nr:sugar ABC transporter substrate-binding protein [Leptolyngbya sp. 15MV]